jgi:hypothetical protein
MTTLPVGAFSLRGTLFRCLARWQCQGEAWPVGRTTVGPDRAPVLVIVCGTCGRTSLARSDAADAPGLTDKGEPCQRSDS